MTREPNDNADDSDGAIRWTDYKNTQEGGR